MGYGIKISFPRLPQWRHRSPGRGDGCEGSVESITMTNLWNFELSWSEKFYICQGQVQGISETFGCGSHVNLISDFRVPVPFQSDRVNLLANPKWQKNAKNNNLHIVWADSVLKINRKDGKVMITEARVAMPCLVPSLLFWIARGVWRKSERRGTLTLCLLLPVTLRALFVPRLREDWRRVRATSTSRVS